MIDIFKLVPKKNDEIYDVNQWEEGCTWELKYPIIAVPLLFLILPVAFVVTLIISPVQYIWHLIRPKTKMEKWLVENYGRL